MSRAAVETMPASPSWQRTNRQDAAAEHAFVDQAAHPREDLGAALGDDALRILGVEVLQQRADRAVTAAGEEEGVVGEARDAVLVEAIPARAVLERGPHGVGAKR